MSFALVCVALGAKHESMSAMEGPFDTPQRREHIRGGGDQLGVCFVVLFNIVRFGHQAYRRAIFWLRIGTNSQAESNRVDVPSLDFPSSRCEFVFWGLHVRQVFGLFCPCMILPISSG